MHMIDWNTYRGQVSAGVGEMAKLTPDTIEGYLQLGQSGGCTDRLNGKTRELIALAVAVSLRCDGCIALHTSAARKFGATGEELAEALGVAVSIAARAALVYSTHAFDAFDAAAETQGA